VNRIGDSVATPPAPTPVHRPLRRRPPLRRYTARGYAGVAGEPEPRGPACPTRGHQYPKRSPPALWPRMPSARRHACRPRPS